MNRTRNSATDGGDPKGADDFMRWLSRQPFRKPPEAWREWMVGIPLEGEVCRAGADGSSAARYCGAVRPVDATAPERGVDRRSWTAWLSGWGWVAAAWLLIVGLNHLVAGRPTAGMEPRPPFSEAARAVIREEQRAVLAQLAGAGMGDLESSPTAGRRAPRLQTKKPVPEARLRVRPEVEAVRAMEQRTRA